MGKKATSKDSYLCTQQTQSVARVQLFTCYDDIATLGLSGAPISLTSSALGGLNPIQNALLIVFALAGRSLPGHAVRRIAGGESGSFPSGETAVLEPVWEERSAGHLGVRDAKT